MTNPEVDDFLQSLRLRKSPLTIVAYQIDLKQFFQYCQVDTPSVTYRHIELWLRDCASKGMAPRTLARKRAAIASFFGYLARTADLPNPAARVDRLPVPSRVTDYLTINEIEVLKSSCPPDILPLLLFLLSTGVRVSELCSLNWQKVNLDKRIATVLGKGNREREVYFSLLTASMLREVSKPSGPVFTDTRGRRFNPSQVYYRIRKIGRALSLPIISSREHRSIYPHLLRHTYATHLLEFGATIEEVKELLGHQTLAATNIYVHSTQAKREHYDRAIDRFA